MSRIIIIGAGVVGLTTAYYLTEHGYKDITVIDSSTGPAMGTSGINGAQLCYRYVSPMEPMRLFKNIPTLLDSRDQRLRLTSILDYKFWIWSLRVLLSGIGSHYEQKLSTVVSLAEESRSLLLDMKDKLDMSFGYQLNGKLHLFQTAEGMKGYEQSLKSINTPQSMYQVLSAEDALKHDTFLGDCKTNIAGGIFVRDEAVGNCKTFCDHLETYLKKECGIHFQYETSVNKLIRSGDKITGIDTNNGRIVAEHVFVCAGWAAEKMLKPLGVRIGLYPVKGYSLTIPNANKRPETNITVREHFMVFAPIDNGALRITAFKHFESKDYQINPAVVDDMKRRIKDVVPDLDLSNAEVAIGHRPMTPDDMPVLGQSEKYKNLHLNCGHGALGWTLAHGTAKRVADEFHSLQS